MNRIVTITFLIGALSSAAASQTINEQTLTQVVEAKGGQLQTSVRSVVKDSSHIFLDLPASDNGHHYMSFNSLGKSSLTPAQVMNAIESDFSYAFPFMDANGDCGNLKKGNEYSLGGNRVRVTDVGPFHFSLTALPGHRLQGSVDHGVFKDSTGELWLFQVGNGVKGEESLRQDGNYLAADVMWLKMSSNVRDLMQGINASSPIAHGDVDLTFSVGRKRIDTGISVCKGDSVTIAADGEITVDTLGLFTTGPDGLVFPTYAAYNYKYAARCNHGSLLLLIIQANDQFQCACVGGGASNIAPSKGTIQLLVNDTDVGNNTGAFNVRVMVKRQRQ